MAQPFSDTTRSIVPGPLPAAWALAGVLLAGWGAWMAWGRVALVEVSRARLESTAAARPLAAPAGGRLLQVQLPPGAEVQAGQVLLQLDDAPEAAAEAEAQARAEGLRRQAERAQGELEARSAAAGHERAGDEAALAAAAAHQAETEAAVAQAQDLAHRLGAESRDGNVAEVEALRAAAEARRLAATLQAGAAEAARLRAEAAARREQSLGARLALQREREALQGMQAAAEAEVARAAAQRERLRLRAPAAGRIAEALPLQPGDRVEAGQVLATLFTPGPLQVTAEFEPQAALGRLRPGQAATLRLDGFPWAQYGSVPAVVARVAEAARDQRVRVELAPTGPWPAGIEARAGLPGTVEVTVEQVAPAALVLRAVGRTLR